MQIEVSLGREDIGIFDSHAEAIEAASEYAFKKEIHHKFDWSELRRRIGFVSSNSSFSMDGWYFRGVTKNVE